LARSSSPWFAWCVITVLVVDDHPEAAEITCTFLRMLGHDCVMATTGREGLAIAASRPIDIALLDIGLPDISGYEVARTLRSTRGRSIFLAAITGSGDPNDRMRAVEAGFDGYVMKPTSCKVLRDILTAAEARLTSREGSPARP
jgi:DNA-binding response OmpR family regulator